MKKRNLLTLLLLLAGGLLVWLAWPSPPPHEKATIESAARPAEPSRSPASGTAEVRAPLQLAPVAVERDADAGNGIFAGTVVASDSRMPISGAELTFLKAGAAHSVVSDALGRFVLRCPEAGIYELAAVMRGGFVPFAPHWGHSAIRFEARPGLRIDDAVVSLRPTLIASGIVVDEAGGAIAGARVRVRDDRTIASALLPDSPTTTSAEDGRFQLETAPDAIVEARHPEFARAVEPAAESMRITLAPLDGTRAAGRIVGRVVDAEELPIAGALIETGEAGPPAFRIGRRTGKTQFAVSDADGRFELSELDPHPHDLVVDARGYEMTPVPRVPVNGEPITVKLERGGAIVGQVFDAENGAPLPAFSILIDGRLREGAGASVRLSRTYSFFDADGHFRIDGLPAGRCRLRAVAWGYGPSKRQVATVELESAKPTEVEFRLTRGSRVFGVVLDEASSTPLAGAVVWWEGNVRAEDGPFPMSARATTGSDGRFDLYGVAGGLRSITAAADGHHTRIFPGHEAEADGDLGPLTLALAPVAEGEEEKLELTGIGAKLMSNGAGLEVVGVWPTGGAAEAGLAEGDVILAIDGRSVGELSLGDAVELIRGREDTAVQLTIRPPGTDERVELVVIRRRIRG